LILTAYTVYFHGKYGQTLGKRIIGIKVLDMDESSTIGFKRAILRESIWLLFSFSALVYSFFQNGFENQLQEEIATSYDAIISLFTLSWPVVELITMFFNEKRRAVHDFIAQSVVIDFDKP
jgi:uncharacterized RDD family membrane protein YckC